MNALRFLPRRRAPKHLAPTFTPNVRVTAPIHIPAGRHVHPGRIRVARTDMAAMEQALHGIEHIDWPCLDAAKAQEGLTHDEVRQATADPLTAPDWPVAEPAGSRADRFTADMRMAKRGGLPVFRQAARRAGWSGLNREPRSLPLDTRGPRTADRFGESFSLIAAQTDAARTEAARAIAGIHRRAIEGLMHTGIAA